MNPKRLILAIVAVFAGVWISDFLIHGVWLKNDYAATMSLWRPEAEMRVYFPWLLLGQFLMTTTFVVLYAKGFASMACLRCACMFGLFMGVFAHAGSFIMHAVQPLPMGIAVKWFVAGILQGVLMGVIAFFVYKPRPVETVKRD